MSSPRARAFHWLAVVVVLAPCRAAVAQPVAPPDTAEPTEAEREADEKRKLPFHDSLFMWDNSATTESLGIGRETQSRNPTYEMTFRLAPRYYLLDEENRSRSLRADVRLVREFTDSDSTTDRGEWTFTDTPLWLAWVERLRDVPGQSTDLVLQAPMVVLPTSQASYSSGVVLGLGVGAGVDQAVPLRGDDSSFLKSATLRPRASYTYHFASTTVPTNDDIDRVRLDPAGRALPSDQLRGSAFTQHEATLGLGIETLLAEDLSLVTEIGAIYGYRYALDERVEVCGVVDTGCVDVEGDPDASRSRVATVFGVELGYRFSQLFMASVGYANLSSQLGADGQRRSVFYSPDARASVTLTFVLDALYRKVQ